MHYQLRAALLTSVIAAGAFACAGSSPSSPGTCPQAEAAEAQVVAPPSADVQPVTTGTTVPAPAPVLQSWTEGPTRKAIVDFVAEVTDPNRPHFVPERERIAVFDNDGTLWSEQPMYVQLAFALDRVRELAPKHPEWKRKQPFKAVLEGDMAAVVSSGHAGLLELVAATHAGMTTEEFGQIVSQWLGTARHPKYERPYTELTYRPMVELLDYLRQHGFKTFIVSGGGIDFMRPWAEAAYGIPPEQVIGSRLKTELDAEGGTPVIRRKAEVEFIDDGPGKPVAIHAIIGRRPIFAAGNSDGDLQMLQWTEASERPHFSLLVHHTDGDREVAYDRESTMGKLDEALDLAAKEAWVIVDMKRDWKKVFAFEESTGQ